MSVAVHPDYKSVIGVRCTIVSATVLFEWKDDESWNEW